MGSDGQNPGAKVAIIAALIGLVGTIGAALIEHPNFFFPRGTVKVESVGPTPGTSAPPPAASRPTPEKPAEVSPAALLYEVSPSYPQLARFARIQGPVKLSILIGKDGDVVHARLIDGHPMLVAAAIDAVKQWKYSPATLNGESVEEEREVVVNFSLAK